MRKFSSLPGWKLLVVGDTKTPEDWSLPGAIFLSVAKQRQLGYQIVGKIPVRNYGRKSIGYLFAVQHGAEVIYESDDDNILAVENLEVLEEQHPSGFVYTGHSNTLNPYAHFGYPAMWPRGYPLENIIADKHEMVVLKQRPACIPIQQGLADLDPDVDAIWRMTQSQLIGTILFKSDKTPLVLPPGTMSPYNTQNTVQLYSAFWGLLLPVTTSFRVCDIWRGYWVQRILWEIGCSISFTEPLVHQIRNAHDFYRDFLEEDDLYHKAGNLVNFLVNWKAPESAKLPKLISMLAHEMAKEGYWGEEDAKLTDAWLEDLKAVGYKFPERRKDPEWHLEELAIKAGWTRPIVVEDEAEVNEERGKESTNEKSQEPGAENNLDEETSW